MCAIEYYTYEDYKNWEGDWELIDGIPLAMAPSPVKTHQLITTLISYQLLKKLFGCNKCKVMVEIDYKVNEDTILKPDVLVTCKEDKNEDYVSVAPEIIVEVISPSTAKRDEKYKFEIYEAEKVKYYILVYPKDKKAKVYKHNGEKYIKVDDFTTQTYKFDLECEAEINFSEVFERFN
jgi:Uma2 family endonuclease